MQHKYSQPYAAYPPQAINRTITSSPLATTGTFIPPTPQTPPVYMRTTPPNVHQTPIIAQQHHYGPHSQQPIIRITAPPATSFTPPPPSHNFNDTNTPNSSQTSMFLQAQQQQTHFYNPAYAQFTPITSHQQSNYMLHQVHHYPQPEPYKQPHSPSPAHHQYNQQAYTFFILFNWIEIPRLQKILVTWKLHICFLHSLFAFLINLSRENRLPSWFTWNPILFC